MSFIFQGKDTVYQIESVEEIVEEKQEKEVSTDNISQQKSPESGNESNGVTKRGKYPCTKCEMCFDLKIDLKVTF